MAAALVCMIVASLLNVIPPWLFKYVVDEVLSEKNMTVLNVVCISIILVFLLKGVVAYAHQYLINWVGQRLILDIRVRLYDHMQRMSLRYIYGSRVGEMTSRITGDVGTLQSLMTSTMVNLIVNGVTFSGMLLAIFWINWRLSITVLVMLPIVTWLLSFASQRLRNAGHRVQDRLANLTAIVQEAFSAIRIVRAFATERQELARFRTGNEENFDALMTGVRTQAILLGVIEVILISTLALVFWIGGQDVLAGTLTSGELVAFLGYLGFLVQPIRILMSSLNSLQTGFAATERIFEVLDIPEEVEEPVGAVVLDRIRGEIRFEDVRFSYVSGREVLRGITLSIREGEKIAIVGSTGAGKSTLADLILRFYDPAEGRVLIDGHDLRSLSLRTLRRQVGCVPQDPLLMRGTMAFNIAYGIAEEGTSVPAEVVIEAARVAGIHDFIVSLPQGYDTLVGERGITLSGGQRQRVAIARAISRNPRILILDEATSSLDMEVERQVQQAMNRAMAGRTSIIIAHRLSTVRNADRILVLDDGAIAEQGSHESLLRKDGIYARLFRLQFRDSEVPS
jgi:subfamily B ATP-binding cassette protein MsbA